MKPPGHSPRGRGDLGVAIAVALVPPLATVGITFELGARSKSSNALLLFLTNLAAVLAVAVPLTLHTRSTVPVAYLRPLPRRRGGVLHGRFGGVG